MEGGHKLKTGKDVFEWLACQKGSHTWVSSNRQVVLEDYGSSTWLMAECKYCGIHISGFSRCL